MASSLDDVRQRIRELDRRLIELAAERVELARTVGELKRERGQATIDYAQERRVLERAREEAEERGMEPGVAEELLARLIAASVTVQEEESLRHANTGRGRAAVIVGGSGRMGRWTDRFLEAQGWDVLVLDPAASEEREAAEALLPEADLVVSALPPGKTAEYYREWRDRPPRGVIVDIASIKMPLIDAIRGLQREGGRVASIHPMFGPSTFLLRDADVVLCDTGDEEAGKAIEDLFRPTTARLVRLPLEEHDRVMADLLSLAHATAIAVALSLPEREHTVRSTTFQALEGLAARVVRESPEVYYEIQADNPWSLAAVARLRSSLDRLLRIVADRDREGFRSLLEEGRRRTPE